MDSLFLQWVWGTGIPIKMLWSYSGRILPLFQIQCMLMLYLRKFDPIFDFRCRA